jgi:hypothetical protein
LAHSLSPPTSESQSVQSRICGNAKSIPVKTKQLMLRIKIKPAILNKWG